jgi:hypothetical protein
MPACHSATSAPRYNPPQCSTSPPATSPPDWSPTYPGWHVLRGRGPGGHDRAKSLPPINDALRTLKSPHPRLRRRGSCTLKSQIPNPPAPPPHPHSCLGPSRSATRNQISYQRPCAPAKDFCVLNSMRYYHSRARKQIHLQLRGASSWPFHFDPSPGAILTPSCALKSRPNKKPFFLLILVHPIPWHRRSLNRTANHSAIFPGPSITMKLPRVICTAAPEYFGQYVRATDFVPQAVESIAGFGFGFRL